MRQRLFSRIQWKWIVEIEWIFYCCTLYKWPLYFNMAQSETNIHSLILLSLYDPCNMPHVICNIEKCKPWVLPCAVFAKSTSFLFQIFYCFLSLKIVHGNLISKLIDRISLHIRHKMTMLQMIDDCRPYLRWKCIRH